MYDFCSPGPVHRCIHAVVHQIEDHAEAAGLPVRFAATKLIEGDEDIVTRLALDQNELELIEHSVKEMEDECGMDRNAALADMRYTFIETICSGTVVKCRESRERARSEAIDRVVTNKYLALPLFFAIMLGIFFLTFEVIGAFLSDLLAAGIDALTAAVDSGLAAYGLNPVVHSLVIDGVFAGVGSVLSFLPIIVVLFFFLSILEDTGYMARVAFVMDQLLRKIGLSGRSIVPMLVGFGCSVPAIMSTRTLASERDRRMTILLTPFMSCSAKIPIYGVFSAAFFPNHAALVMIGLYILGILVGIVAAKVLGTTVYKGNPVPFVMELPPYHAPKAVNILRGTWERGWSFIKRAGTVIVLASIFVWFTSSFGFVDGHFTILTEDALAAINPTLLDDTTDFMDLSILATIGSAIAIIFQPLGFGNWQASVATFLGLVAKEEVVGCFGTLFGVAGDALELVDAGEFEALTPIAAAFGGSSLAAYSFLVFNLLCAPCFAAIGAIKREMNNAGWTLFAIAYQCVFAYACSLMVFQFGSLFLGGRFTVGTVAAIIVLVAMLYLLFRKGYQGEGSKLRAVDAVHA